MDLDLIGTVDQFTLMSILPVLFLFLFFGIDDFIIDVFSFIFATSPKKISDAQLKDICAIPEKRIAILVAAWKEDGILKKMIEGNTSRINYRNYRFFIGAYPNDNGTLQEAEETRRHHSNVEVVVNSQNGPTCKGQMLNELVHGLMRYEKKKGMLFDAILIHDSEDVIHPLGLKLVNFDLDHHNFVQTPVLSLPLSTRSVVAGIYADEFSESHLKDALVRNALDRSIPSAGVGTALSRHLVEKYLRHNQGELLNTQSLTEDYELGLTSSEYGGRAKFSCYTIQRGDRQAEYVATREYFPKSFWASVKQKTRWTLGIVFQGTEHLGWRGNLVRKYFLYRDRKGPFSNGLTIYGFLLLGYFLARSSSSEFFLDYFRGKYLDSPEVTVPAWFNGFFLTNRMFQRMRCVYIVYGWKMALFVPLRWPVGNLVNFLASARAIFQYTRGKVLGVQPRWSKTQHELPSEFGVAS